MEPMLTQEEINLCLKGLGLLVGFGSGLVAAMAVAIRHYL